MMPEGWGALQQMGGSQVLGVGWARQPRLLRPWEAMRGRFLAHHLHQLPAFGYAPPPYIPFISFSCASAVFAGRGTPSRVLRTLRADTAPPARSKPSPPLCPLFPELGLDVLERGNGS